MNPYVDVLARVLAKIPADDVAGREALFGRARDSVVAAFGKPDLADELRAQLAQLDAAVVQLRGSHPAPPAPGRAALDQPEVPPPLAEAAPAAKPAASRPPPFPFSDNGGIADRYEAEVSAGEYAAMGKVKAAALLLLLIVCGGVLLMRPDLLPQKSPAAYRPAQPTAPAAAPAAVATSKWRDPAGRGGDVAWTLQPNRSTLTNRRNARRALTGAADMRPGLPSMQIVFAPNSEDTLRATHYFDFMFEEAGTVSIWTLLQFRLLMPDGETIEPEGVVVRTGSHSFAFLFSGQAKDSAVNVSLLGRASAISVVLRGAGDVQTATIDLPDLTPYLSGG
jgi:hypothetical protein